MFSNDSINFWDGLLPLAATDEGLIPQILFSTLAASSFPPAAECEDIQPGVSTMMPLANHWIAPRAKEKKSTNRHEDGVAKLRPRS